MGGDGGGVAPGAVRRGGLGNAAREIGRFAWKRYRGLPLSVRLLMRFRPRICPLDVVADAVPRGSRVLDIGCGAGLLLGWLAEAYGTGGVGVDTSARAVEMARTSVRAGEDLRFECHSPDAPWPSGPFDVITVVDVLHHVPPADQRAFVGRLAASGVPRVLLKDLDPRPRWKAWMNALHDFLMTGKRVYPRAMRDVVAWLEADGFRVTRAERVDRLWYSHYLVEAARAAPDGG